VWFYALGALLVLAAGVTGDPTAPIVPLLGAIAGLTAGWLALIVLLIDETDEGFANVYSTSVSIQNFFPRANQRALIAGICGFVLVVALLVPLAQYESFLLLIGSAFVPLLGVLAADYFVLSRRHYDAASLLGGTESFRWPGIAAWLTGVAAYLLIAGVPALGITGLAPWLGASLPSFLIAFALHIALNRGSVRRPAAVPARP
jgi:purine-cytosine permease-like protein